MEGMRGYKLLVYDKLKGYIVQHGKHRQHFITTVSRVNLDCTPVIYIISMSPAGGYSLPQSHHSNLIHWQIFMEEVLCVRHAWNTEVIKTVLAPAFRKLSI